MLGQVHATDPRTTSQFDHTDGRDFRIVSAGSGDKRRYSYR